MSSNVSHSIKHRKVPNDVFITPRELAMNHINMIDYTKDDVWYDPCRYNINGSYYSQFPKECNKTWSEITEGFNFLESDMGLEIGEPTIICCNPPWSIMDKWIEKCIEFNPRVISFLIGQLNLTPKRIEILNNAGYGLSKWKMLKVKEWYGISMCVVFEKGKENIIEIDRKVYYTLDKVKKEKTKPNESVSKYKEGDIIKSSNDSKDYKIKLFSYNKKNKDGDIKEYYRKKWVLLENC